MRRFLRCGVAGILAAALVPAAAAAATNDPLRSQQWGLDMIHADEAHAVSTGAGAVVAVVDTGITAGHPDLAGRVLPGYDFVDRDSDPRDGDGHGTHVSGIIAAAANNGVGVDSVAPGAQILPVRVLDNEGTGDDATVAEGIDWATAHGADVINLSLSGQLPLSGLGVTGQMDDAVQRAVDHGVVVVAAAGNDSLPTCENSSYQGRVLCVGAVDRRGQRSFYSSFGNGLGLVAPGGAGTGGDEDILSTWNDGGYHTLAGTSQAVPHVAGAAALLVSKGVRGQAAVQRILAMASDAGPSGPDAVYGAGILDAQAAVAGLGGAGSTSGARSSGGPRVTIRRRQHIRYVLSRGIRIICLAPGNGRCVARARSRRETIARGSTSLTIGQARTFGARPTRKGKRLLRSALHRRRSLVARVTVKLPGGQASRRVRLIP
jgi:serine protease